MPGANEVIASSRARLFLVPPTGGKPISIGLVEDFSCTDNYTPEFFLGIGDVVPTDSVINTGGPGAFRWGRVHKLRRDVLSAIRPEISRFHSFPEFDLLVADPNDNKPIALCRGCRPNMFETQTNNGRAMRENYGGGCRFIKRGDEILEADAA